MKYLPGQSGNPGGKSKGEKSCTDVTSALVEEWDREVALQRLLALRDQAREIYTEESMVAIAYCLTQQQRLEFIEILLETSQPWKSH